MFDPGDAALSHRNVPVFRRYTGSGAQSSNGQSRPEKGTFRSEIMEESYLESKQQKDPVCPQTEEQGDDPGKCVVTATCGTKKRVFAVNVTEKENAEEKGSVNVSLVSAQYTQQKITVTVNIANGMTDEICFGMDALFYRLNADGKYSPVANEVAIPMVLAVVQPGKSQEQSFACINTKEGLVQGHYKIAFTIWGGSDGEKSTMMPQEVEFDV